MLGKISCGKVVPDFRSPSGRARRCSRRPLACRRLGRSGGQPKLQVPCGGALAQQVGNSCVRRGIGYPPVGAQPLA